MLLICRINYQSKNLIEHMKSAHEKYRRMFYDTKKAYNCTRSLNMLDCMFLQSSNCLLVLSYIITTICIASYFCSGYFQCYIFLTETWSKIKWKKLTKHEFFQVFIFFPLAYFQVHFKELYFIWKFLLRQVGYPYQWCTLWLTYWRCPGWECMK